MREKCEGYFDQLMAMAWRIRTINELIYLFQESNLGKLILLRMVQKDICRDSKTRDYINDL